VLARVPVAQVEDDTEEDESHLVKKGCFVIIYYGFGLLLHLWTVAIAFLLTSDLVTALITFGLPVISNIYWFFKMGVTYGFFGSHYNISIIFYIIIGASWNITHMYLQRNRKFA
jgi:hypothetical protein